jgi:hypothetical protein
MLNNPSVDQNITAAEIAVSAIRMISGIGIGVLGSNITTLYEFYARISSDKQDIIARNNELQATNSGKYTGVLVGCNLSALAACAVTLCYPAEIYTTATVLCSSVAIYLTYNHMNSLKAGLESYINAKVNNDLVERDIDQKSRSCGSILYKIIMGPESAFSSYVNSEVHRRRSTRNNVVTDR